VPPALVLLTAPPAPPALTEAVLVAPDPLVAWLAVPGPEPLVVTSDEHAHASAQRPTPIVKLVTRSREVMGGDETRSAPAWQPMSGVGGYAVKNESLAL
jgi:hypothetical protein